MTDRRSFIKAAGAIGGVALTSGCIGQFGKQPYGDGKLTWIMSPSEPESQLRKQYGPVIDFLDKNVKDSVKSELNYGRNYTAVLQALSSGTADIADTGPFAAVLGAKDDKLEIALQRRGYGSWTYQSVIVTRDDTDIQKPSDLKGKKIAFADMLSASGSLFPLYMLKKRGGLDLGKAPVSDEGADFKASWATHGQAFQALKQGKVDAAGVGRFITLNESRSGYKEGIREVSRYKGIPDAPVVVSPKLSDEEKKKLVKALEGAPKKIYHGADGKEGTDDDLWFNAVRSASMDTYSEVKKVAETVGVTTDLFEKA